MAESTKDIVPDTVRTSEGDALRRLIESSEFSQQTLAAASGVGSKGFLWQVVSGHRPLNLEVAAKLAKTLNVKIDAFSPRLADMVRETSSLVLQTGATPEAGAESGAKEPIQFARIAEASSARNAWPFSTLTPAEYAMISPESRAEVDAMVKGMYIEASRRGKMRGN